MFPKTNFVVLIAILFYGCTTMVIEKNIDKTIEQYHSVASKVQLGDKKERVLEIILPTQKELPLKAAKQPDQFLMEDGRRVEIYYMRSGRQPDNLTTDDEFMPYIFVDDVLIGVGWQLLGGPKTHGQTVRSINVNPSSKPTNKGLNFMCKDAISRGDQGGTFIFC